MAVPLALFATPAVAQTEPGLPFIKAEYWKKNISLQQLRENPRQYFRSERAFDLLVEYVSGEIGQPLMGSQFIALIRSDQVGVRNCPMSEQITTGFIRGNEFDWQNRNCRKGEQIVYYLLEGRRIDLFSLNCLNGVEDKTPVLPPTQAVNRFAPVPPVPLVPLERPQQPTMVIWQSPGISIGGSIMSFGCVCCGRQQVFGTAAINIPGQVNQTTTFGF